jgi:hypothetical protein
MEQELENELKSILENAHEELSKDMQLQNDEMLKLIESKMYGDYSNVADNEHYLWKVVIHVEEASEDKESFMANMSVEGIAVGGDIYEMLQDRDVQQACKNAHALICMVHARGRKIDKETQKELESQEQCRVTILISNAGVSAVARFESNPDKVRNEGITDKNSKLARALIGFYNLTASISE